MKLLTITSGMLAAIAVTVSANPISISQLLPRAKATDKSHEPETLPAIIIPDITASAITVLATTLSAITVPATTVSEITLRATTLPATTRSETTISAITLSATTLSETTIPATTLSATILPATKRSAKAALNPQTPTRAQALAQMQQILDRAKDSFSQPEQDTILKLLHKMTHAQAHNTTPPPLNTRDGSEDGSIFCDAANHLTLPDVAEDIGHRATLFAHKAAEAKDEANAPWADKEFEGFDHRWGVKCVGYAYHRGVKQLRDVEAYLLGLHRDCRTYNDAAKAGQIGAPEPFIWEY